MTPELYRTLESNLECHEFEIEIPRRCMEERVIKEKLHKVHPSQRVQELKRLMDEHGLEKVVLLNPVDSKAVLTSLS